MDLGFDLKDLITIAVVAGGGLIQWGVSRAEAKRLTNDVSDHDRVLGDFTNALKEMQFEIRTIGSALSGHAEWRKAAEQRENDLKKEIDTLRIWRHEIAGWAQRAAYRLYMLDNRSDEPPTPRPNPELDVPK